MEGKLHGDFCIYYPNERKYMEGSFYNGELHGKYVTWGVNGTLEWVGLYDSGKQVETHQFQSVLYNPVLLGVC
jgi:antitoxin component YwqK of YwqJK toxin-antitoxin module